MSQQPREDRPFEGDKDETTQRSMRDRLAIIRKAGKVPAEKITNWAKIIETNEHNRN